MLRARISKRRACKAAAKACSISKRGRRSGALANRCILRAFQALNLKPARPPALLCDCCEKTCSFKALAMSCKRVQAHLIVIRYLDVLVHANRLHAEPVARTCVLESIQKLLELLWCALACYCGRLEQPVTDASFAVLLVVHR
jgi:hypothetical protein